MRFLQSPSGWFTLAFLSGILLSAAWPASGFAPLLFVALVPLLFAEDSAKRQSDKYSGWLIFAAAYLAFFTFNLLTTWWVKYASLFGAVAAIVCNALFMAIVFQLFHATRKKLKGVTGYLSLPAYWLTFEYLHMDWDLSWPWLTLGNGFAGWERMIQWYEFTGILGGSLWILTVNIFVYVAFKQRLFYNVIIDYRRNILIVILLIAIPVGWSFYRYYNYRENPDPVRIAVIQPNIDPYNEKFTGMTPDEQLIRILELAASVSDSTTDYIVAPETALPEGMWEEFLSDHHQIRKLGSFISGFSDTRWVIGLATYKMYPDSNQRSVTARKFTQQDGYYDSFNTAMQLDNAGDIQLHHKSKLVPGVEKMPFPAIFRHLDRFAIDLGGISGSLGVQDVPSVFRSGSNNINVAPVICYESIYGGYLAEYVRQGANLIFIITNDGWWSDTPGYRQHLKYATLRAIEARRSIARSANTGISCFINQRGDILQPTGWWVPAAIKSEMNANSDLTLHSRLGDYPGPVAMAATVYVLLSLTYRRMRQRSGQAAGN